MARRRRDAVLLGAGLVGVATAGRVRWDGRVDDWPRVAVRDAALDDVAAICRFGELHIPPHYTPLLGAQAAADQVRHWWSPAAISAAVEAGLVVVAETPDGAGGPHTASTGREPVTGRREPVPDGPEIVGVAQHGRSGADHVVYKLYVHPAYRGRGLGLQLLREVVERLPEDAERLCIEHFAANARAGEFYERAGYAVERVEPSPTGDPALAVVWRARRLRPE